MNNEYELNSVRKNVEISSFSTCTYLNEFSKNIQTLEIGRFLFIRYFRLYSNYVT